MSLTREEMQEEAKLKAIESLDLVSSAALLMGTGSGKSKTVIDILKHYNPDKITWLTNSTKLRDEDTPAEFVKWDAEYLMEKTNFICYHSAYKLEGEDLGFVVCDEGDVSLTEKYSLVYENNDRDKLLFVSATTRDDQKEMLAKLAPVVYSIGTQDAQDAGILNKTKFIFVDYMLDTRRNIRMETKTKSWMTSEQDNYDYLERQYTRALIEFLEKKRLVDDWYRSPDLNSSVSPLMAAKQKAYTKMNWVNSKRFNFLCKLNSSKAITKRLLTKIYANEANKTIVFSNFTEEIDKICKYTYHSKNKGTKANPNLTLEKFNSGEIRVAGVCSIINRGANMTGLNHGIFESYDGSNTKGQQKIGRFCRLLADNEATIYILRPYYTKKYKVRDEEGHDRIEVRRASTRAVAWSESMLSDFRLDENNSKTIDESEI